MIAATEQLTALDLIRKAMRRGGTIEQQRDRAREALKQHKALWNEFFADVIDAKLRATIYQLRQYQYRTAKGFTSSSPSPGAPSAEYIEQRIQVRADFFWSRWPTHPVTGRRLDDWTGEEARAEAAEMLSRARGNLAVAYFYFALGEKAGAKRIGDAFNEKAAGRVWTESETRAAAVCHVTGEAPDNSASDGGSSETREAPGPGCQGELDLQPENAAAARASRNGKKGRAIAIMNSGRKLPAPSPSTNGKARRAILQMNSIHDLRDAPHKNGKSRRAITRLNSHRSMPAALAASSNGGSR